MQKSKYFEYLVDAFKSLPGVGKKNAYKYAYFVINQDNIYARTFSQHILDAKNNLIRCNVCNNISEFTVCEVCKNPNRSKSLCIVATDEDFDRINDSNSYEGYYFILGGEIGPKSKFKLDDINIQKLMIAINTLKVNEVIIATSFSLNGEATAEYIKSKLKNLNEISLYRIGFGIPLNANIDFIDDETIKESFISKRKF